MASDGAGAFDEVMKDDDTKVEKLPGLPIIIVTLDQNNGWSVPPSTYTEKCWCLNIVSTSLHLLCVSTSHFPHLAVTRWPAA